MAAAGSTDSCQSHFQVPHGIVVLSAPNGLGVTASRWNPGRDLGRSLLLGTESWQLLPASSLAAGTWRMHRYSNRDQHTALPRHVQAQYVMLCIYNVFVATLPHCFLSSTAALVLRAQQKRGTCPPSRSSAHLHIDKNWVRAKGDSCRVVLLVFLQLKVLCN